MPSPFLGMDPFLEDLAIFPDLHDSLIFCLREAMTAQLPEAYYAAIANRAWVEMTHRRVEPDVNVLRPRPAPLTQNGGPPASGGGGVAVAEAVQTEPVVVHVEYEERHETLVEIYVQPGGERLVTTVEILSRANKTPRARGRKQYRKKQREMLNSQVNLVEIDLLRYGTHTTAVPLDHALAQTGPFDYHACVHCFDEFSDYLVYPIRLGARLPVIAIPLLPGDPAVRIDLQPLLDRCYDVGSYRRRARYRDPITAPPLRPEQQEWAEGVLRAKGILEPLPPS